MEETKEHAVSKPTGRFQLGHAKVGGRRKRSPQEVRALAEKYGADPIDFLLKIIASDTVHEVQIVDGKKTRVEVPVTMAMKVDACRIVAGYMYAKLSTTQVTGRDEGPLAVQTIDVAKILADPELSAKAQALAFAMCEADASQHPVPTLPPAPEDELVLEKDSLGQYRS